MVALMQVQLLKSPCAAQRVSLVANRSDIHQGLIPMKCMLLPLRSVAAINTDPESWAIAPVLAPLISRTAMLAV